MSGQNVYPICETAAVLFGKGEDSDHTPRVKRKCTIEYLQRKNEIEMR